MAALCPTDPPDSPPIIATDPLRPGTQGLRLLAAERVHGHRQPHHSGVIQSAIGRPVPVILHELEYYEEIARRTGRPTRQGSSTSSPSGSTPGEASRQFPFPPPPSAICPRDVISHHRGLHRPRQDRATWHRGRATLSLNPLHGCPGAGVPSTSWPSLLIGAQAVVRGFSGSSLLQAGRGTSGGPCRALR